MESRLQHLINTVNSQFNSRAIIEARRNKTDYGLSLDTYLDKDAVLWLSFTKENERLCITIPTPKTMNGITLIECNDVRRAVCAFWIESSQREIDYINAIYSVILDVPSGLISNNLIKATSYLQQMIYGFANGNASIVAYKFQKAINEVVSKMPLHETNMNSYIMNNRLLIVDPAFDAIISPEGKLAYQKNKAVKYFDRGWTVIGLSDGGLAEKNYILKTDIKKLSPFGLKYHNPQRNLYSTLSMKGDELPIIRSRSMQNLMDIGISRTGWNLFTAFVDIPDVFEDQIVVDESMKDKFVEYDKRFQVFGEILVKEGDTVRTNGVIGTSPDGENVTFDVLCDSARVDKISKTNVAVGGSLTPVYNITIVYRRNFIDGFKLTNLHGNKGIVRLMKLGYAVDPRSGEKRKIDIVVGAKTVGKRKNYGQILEALTNSILEEQETVLPDSWSQPIDEIYSGLERRGFRSDGTWECDLYVGKVKAVCGTVFWGCISTPHDQIWGDRVLRHNGKEIRTAGLKFSHVEIRALETRFGEDNPIIKEVISYVQGVENLHEITCMLKSKVAELPENKRVVGIESVKPVSQINGTIIPGYYISGTVVDEFYKPEGFIFKLPIPYQVFVDKKGKVFHEGAVVPVDMLSSEQRLNLAEEFIIDKLYFPSGVLRKCWRHPTGKFGLSEIGVIINNVVNASHAVTYDAESPISYKLYFGALFNYFFALAKMLGGKNGEISTMGMSVRYPFSAKGYATLSSTLPKNTVEIHREMASALKVSNGDVVIVERFPCLGFMSVRPQKVRVTDDPMCRFTIRASGNSLVSQNLDFDGDTLYIASFHTPAAKQALRKEWTNPNRTCYQEIQNLNDRKGRPNVKEYTLRDFNISTFNEMTCAEHAEIVEKNTGVKAQTGPVIALTYNLMRIVEASGLAKDQKMKVAVEMFLEKAAQSVFEQKHGGKSLYEIVIDGICTANVEMLVDVGFKRGTTEKLCALIERRARAMGVPNLVQRHEKAKSKGWSNIISAIVKKHNRIYFASRSKLEGTELLKALAEPAVDICSKMYKWTTSGKSENLTTELDKILTRDKIKTIKNPDIQDACSILCDLLDQAFKKPVHILYRYTKMLQDNRIKLSVGGYGNYEASNSGGRR